MKTPTRANADGFTLIELIMVTGIISIVFAISMMIVPGLINQSRADASVANVLNTLRLARDRAIGDRRNMELVFTAPRQLQVVRQGIFGEPNETILDTFLEGTQRFMNFTGLDDPGDNFGVINAPFAFGPTEGVVPTIMFTSEGTLVDGTGDPINGTLFFGTPGEPTSARAMTIFGATALLRTWRWNGVDWIE